MTLQVTEEELTAQGVPLYCGCGGELTHFVTKTEVETTCTKCGDQDVYAELRFY